MEKTDRHLTLIYIDDDGNEISFPSILAADSGYFTFNRISILGNGRNYIDSHRLAWSQNNFRSVAGDFGDELLFGQGTVTSSGASRGGVGIDEETIYPIAGIEINNITKIYAVQSERISMSLILWPRPLLWPAPFLTHYREGNVTKRDAIRSKWQPLPIGIQFRLTSMQFNVPRKKDTIGEERFWMPAIILRPRANRSSMDDEEFQSLCKVAWDILKPALSFYFCSEIWLTEKTTVGRSRLTTRSWPKEITPETGDHRHDRHRWDVPPAKFGANSVQKALSARYDPSSLHAAVYSYLSATVSQSLEGELLSFVEAIEKIVHLNETAVRLNRRVLSPEAHKRFKKALKLKLTSPDLWRGITNDKRVQIQSFLAQNPNLTLEQRISRMIKKYIRHFSKFEVEVFSDLETMISIRNNITHGRMPDDYDALIREKHRAKLLADKLFLCLFGMPKVNVSTEHREFILKQYDGGSIVYANF